MIDNTVRDDPTTLLGASSHEPGSSPLQGATQAEVADYIADMLLELRELSSASGQTPLSLLLELAQREARRDAARAMSVNQAPPPPLLAG